MPRKPVAVAEGAAAEGELPQLLDRGPEVEEPPVTDEAACRCVLQGIS